MATLVLGIIICLWSILTIIDSFKCLHNEDYLNKIREKLNYPLSKESTYRLIIKIRNFHYLLLLLGISLVLLGIYKLTKF